MVNENNRPILENIFDGLEIEYKIVIENVANAIKNHHDFSIHNKKIEKLSDFDYGKYHTLEEINDWVDLLAQEYSNYVSVINVTRSFENRYLKAFKISIPSSTPKKAMWFDGGIHALVF